MSSKKSSPGTQPLKVVQLARPGQGAKPDFTVLTEAPSFSTPPPAATNVESFEKARDRKVVSELTEQTHKAWGHIHAGLFKIPMRDVTRYQDGANDEPDAPVTFGPKATAAIQRLVSAFRMERMPHTAKELQAIRWYCWFLYGRVNRLIGRTEEEVEMLKGVTMANMDKYSPAIKPAIQAVFDEDWDALERFHRTTGTVAALAACIESDGEMYFGNLVSVDTKR